MQGKQLLALNKATQVIIQGFGRQGMFHAVQMKEYGTNIVAAVTKGEGLNAKIENIPVYSTVKDALKKHKAEWSVLFVPAKNLKGAAFEALENRLNIVIITEGVPVYDAIEIAKKASQKKLVVIGPNCPGLVKVGEIKLGIMPNHIFLQKIQKEKLKMEKGQLEDGAGKKEIKKKAEEKRELNTVSIVSRSGTLTYEIANLLTQADIPQRFVIGIGGDPILGTDFIPILELFQNDKKTEAIVIIGEIGGSMEQQAAEFIKKHVTKPVIAYIAGKTAPKGKKMGHAGAIILGESGTAESKIRVLEAVGAKIADLPSDIIRLLEQPEDKKQGAVLK